MAERLPKPSKAIERYVAPTPISNPDVLHGLVRCGLTPQFPDKLRMLNDALATRRSQFAGLRITLAPAQNDPAPIVEVKRGKKSFVTIDIDADPYEPQESKALLTIDANDRAGIRENQTHANIVNLLSKLEPGKQYSLVGISDITHQRRLSVDDISKFDIDGVDERLIGAMNYFIYEAGLSAEDFVMRLKLSIGFTREQRFWDIMQVKYHTQASRVERALPILAEFFNYDPHEDPALLPNATTELVVPSEDI